MIAADVLAPADREEAAALIAEPAHDHFWLSGQGTGAALLPQPGMGATQICTGRLNRIVEYEPADLTVTVEAGCQLGVLQEALGAAGQFLPVDYPASGTVGGLVATAAAGPRALGYGSIRERLLGVTAITPEGQLVRSGSRVVKSVSGFDLHRLYCGSFGTLVLIVEATFKLAPLPARHETLGFVGSRSLIAEFAGALLGSQLRPTSLVATGGARSDDGQIVVVIEGGAARVQRLDQEIRTLAVRLALQPDSPPNAIAKEATAGPCLTLQVSAAAARDAFLSPPFPGEVMADFGTGQVVLQLESAPEERNLSALKAQLQPGDSLSYSAEGNTLRRRRLEPGTRELARRIKQALDPSDRLNRGLLETLL